MALSSNLISQFVKITNDKKTDKKETTVYGTVIMYDGKPYIKIDGSDRLTPITTTSVVNDNERVTATIKNHSVVVTGNITNPSTNDISVDNKVGEVDKKVDAELAEIKEEQASLMGGLDDINDIKADNVEIKGRLETAEADIGTLQAGHAELGNVVADNVTVTEQLVADQAIFEETTTTELNAQKASIEDLRTNKLSASDADIKYANIDFSNIGNAAMEYLYSKSGLIENVIIGDGTITGVLAGVTIKGGLIEGNTIVADKLVILGEDGLYYKLNTNGVTTGAEQTEYNSLNGSIITAKSITATQINVSDLVAFDATIGGFNITENSIFSEVKDSEENTIRGIYMDTDGQFNFGDGFNFVKYYRQDDGSYKLVISAETIMYMLNGTPHDISDLGMIGEYVKIGTHEGEPCIELGEKDSDFKLLITNTKILFMEGTAVVAYISNQALHIEKAVIEEELQQGDFVWKVRENGNLGLVWIGVNS